MECFGKEELLPIITKLGCDKSSTMSFSNADKDS